MLVLGRGKRQSVIVGDEIALTVEKICDSVDGRHTRASCFHPTGIPQRSHYGL